MAKWWGRSQVPSARCRTVDARKPKGRSDDYPASSWSVAVKGAKDGNLPKWSAVDGVKTRRGGTSRPKAPPYGSPCPVTRGRTCGGRPQAGHQVRAHDDFCARTQNGPGIRHSKPRRPGDSETSTNGHCTIAWNGRAAASVPWRCRPQARHSYVPAGNDLAAHGRSIVKPNRTVDGIGTFRHR